MAKLSIICVLIFVTGCTKHDQKNVYNSLPANNAVLASTTTLATIKVDQKPRDIETYTAHSESPSAKNLPASLQVVFSESGKGVAFVVETGDMLAVVHNGKTGRSYKVIEDLTLSADGSRVAYSIKEDGNARMVLDGIEGPYFEEANPPVFSPDGRHLAYMAKSGDKWHLIVDTSLNEGALNYRGNPFFSADSQKIVYADTISDNGKVRLVVSDLKFKPLHIMDSCGLLIVMNAGKTRIAAVAESAGKKRVVEFAIDLPDSVKRGKEFDAVESLKYGPNGISVAYVAMRGAQKFLVLNDREEALPEGVVNGEPVINPDLKGVGVIMSNKGKLYFHQGFSKNKQSENVYEEATDLVYNFDGSLHAYTARKGPNFFLVINGKEGAPFDRIVTPQFSPDGKYVVYRARKTGQRFVVVADATGKIVKQLKPYDMVFQPVFTADGTSFGYGIREGQQLIWKVDSLK